MPHFRNPVVTFTVAVLLAVLTSRDIHAQDTTPPTISITSVDVIPAGAFSNFIINLVASDDQQIDRLEYRARVNGRPFSPWYPYTYVAGYPLYFGVHCTSFGVQVRTVDTAGNLSRTVAKEFHQPFREAKGTPITPGFIIEDSPDVLVSGNKAIVIMQKFAAPKKPAAAAAAPVGSRAATPRKRRGVTTYEVSATDISSGQTRRATSKKNIFTFKKLPPGFYSTSYKARFTRNKVVLAETAESPAELFSIGF